MPYKKIKFVLKIVLLITALIAQNEVLFAQNYLIRVGWNSSNMYFSDNNNNPNDYFKWIPGSQLGLIKESTSFNNIVFQTGLILTAKGNRIAPIEISYWGEPFTIEGKVILLYLDIPLLVKVTKDIGGGKVFLECGPYVGRGLTGRTESTITTENEIITEEGRFKFGNDKEKSDGRLLDYGAILGMGIDINHFQINASYSLGLANVSHESNNGSRMSNKVFSLTLGYRFFRSKAQ